MEIADPSVCSTGKLHSNEILITTTFTLSYLAGLWMLLEFSLSHYFWPYEGIEIISSPYTYDKYLAYHGL